MTLSISKSNLILSLFPLSGWLNRLRYEYDAQVGTSEMTQVKTDAGKSADMPLTE